MPPKKINPEQQIQTELAKYLRTRGLLFTATTGGIAYHPRQLIRQKAMGYQRGVPDVLIFEARQGFHGLAIELKAPNGRLSDCQHTYLARLRENGFAAHCCYSLQEAIEAVEKYLRIESEK